nr:hypothetical protein [uncultured Dongia sp.]
MSRTSTLSSTLAIALSLGTLALHAAPAAADGINALVTVTQLKAQNANDEALEQSAASQSQTGPLILETTAELPTADVANADANRGQAEKRLSDHRNEMRRNWAP